MEPAARATDIARPPGRHEAGMPALGQSVVCCL